MTAKQRIAYACHEAGHVVATYLLPERETVSVSIIPNEGMNALGMHIPKYPDWVNNDELQKLEPHAVAWLLDTIVTTFAGAEAERLSLGHYNKLGTLDDGEQIHKWSLHLCGDQYDSERKALLNWLKIRARNLVRRHWDLIAAVAEALLEYKALTGAQVQEVISKAQRERRGELTCMYRHSTM